MFHCTVKLFFQTQNFTYTNVQHTHLQKGRITMEAVIEEETHVTHRQSWGKQHLNNDTLKENAHALANIWLWTIIRMLKVNYVYKEHRNLNSFKLLWQILQSEDADGPASTGVDVVRIIIVNIRLETNMIYFGRLKWIKPKKAIFTYCVYSSTCRPLKDGTKHTPSEPVTL